MNHTKFTIIETAGIPKVPAIPMRRILSQFVYANKYPLRMCRPEEFIRAFYLYNKIAKQLN